MLGFAVAIDLLGLGGASQQGILISYKLQDVFQVHVCHWVGESRDLQEHCTLSGDAEVALAVHGMQALCVYRRLYRTPFLMLLLIFAF